MNESTSSHISATSTLSSISTKKGLMKRFEMQFLISRLDLSAIARTSFNVDALVAISVLTSGDFHKYRDMDIYLFRGYAGTHPS